MALERIMQFLGWLGSLVLALVTVPASWQPFTKVLPLWAFGLTAVIVALIVFKIITHMVFKILMWGAIAVLIVIILSSLHDPVAKWLAGFGQIPI